MEQESEVKMLEKANALQKAALESETGRRLELEVSLEETTCRQDAEEKLASATGELQQHSWHIRVCID